MNSMNYHFFSVAQLAAVWIALSIAGGSLWAQEDDRTDATLTEKEKKTETNEALKGNTGTEESEPISLVRSAAGFEMFRILTANPEFLPDGGNLVLSPANLEPILLALEAGAEGKTAQELSGLLRPAGCRITVLSKPESQTSGQPSAPVGLWVEENWPVRSGYIETLKQRLGIETNSASFEKNEAAQVEKINQWVEEATKGQIRELFKSGDLDANTRLVLASALAYEGNWDLPFDPKYTKPAEFMRGGGQTPVTTPMMHQVGDLSSAVVDGVGVVALPLEGGKQRGVFILPTEKGDPLEVLRDLEKTLSIAQYCEWTTALEPGVIDLKIPRIDVTARSSIKAALQLLGAGSMFSSQTAEFGKISEEEGICVSILRHEVTLQLDEEGARGSAATGAALAARGWSSKPVPWVFNRPFLYAIESVESGEVQFLGRYVGPSNSD